MLSFPTRNFATRSKLPSRPTRTTTVLGLLGTWNIFDGFASKGQVLSDRSTLGTTIISRDAMRLQITNEVRDAYARLLSARQITAERQGKRPRNPYVSPAFRPKPAMPPSSMFSRLRSISPPPARREVIRAREVYLDALADLEHAVSLKFNDWPQTPVSVKAGSSPDSFPCQPHPPVTEMNPPASRLAGPLPPLSRSDRRASVLAASGARAADPPTLTLRQCLQIALDHNPSLRIASGQFLDAEGRAPALTPSFIPILNAQALTAPTTLYVQVNQVFYSRATAPQLRISRLARPQAVINYEQTINDIVFQVRQAFFTALAAQQYVDFVQASARRQASAVASAEDLFRAGKVKKTPSSPPRSRSISSCSAISAT